MDTMYIISFNVIEHLMLALHEIFWKQNFLEAKFFEQQTVVKASTGLVDKCETKIEKELIRVGIQKPDLDSGTVGI